MERRARPQVASSLVVAGLLAVVAVAGQGPPGPSPVGATEARQHDVRALVRLPGTVQARTASLVASEVAGLVVELAAREGDRVRRGAPIVKLRQQTLALRLEAVRAQLQEAEARLELAERNRQRSRDLFESGVISQQQLDDSVSESDAWQGRVGSLEADRARLEDDLDRAVIRAPFSGVIVARHTEVGQWIDVGGAVVEMASLEDLEVVVEVPERYFSELQLGIPATAGFEALPETEVEGVISAIIPRADPQARTFPVKVRIRNEAGRIGVGMLARVAFPTGDARPATVVPKDALVTQGGSIMVYVIGEDGVAQPVPVSTGAGVGSWIEVRGPVQAGQSVVTKGNERLRPGQQVVAEPVEYELP